MADLDRTPGTYDRQTARRAEGILAEANAAQVLGVADVHVAARLARLLDIRDPAITLAAALAVRAVRTGSVACDLTTVHALDPEFAWPPTTEDAAAWLAAVEASPLVAQRILRSEFGLLYLDRYWEQEVAVAESLRQRAALPPPQVDDATLAAALDRLFPDPRDADQRRAGELAVRSRTTIITGGPGTGKTTTVARVLALLAEQHTAAGASGDLRVALVAPTAKAANRLGGAFVTAREALPAADRARVADAGATTLHRLLGWNPTARSRFRHNRDNRLPHDVVVLDEASMVSLTLMARLLEALRPSTRLLVVGDPDQLASVEAGAVLADLVAGLGADGAQEHSDAGPAPADEASAAAPRSTIGARHPGAGPALADGASAAPSPSQDGDGCPAVIEDVPAAAPRPVQSVARLRHTYRFGGTIGELAEAIRAGDAAATLRLLTGGAPEATLIPDAEPRKALLVASALTLRERALDGDARGALDALAHHRLLCAHRTGPVGVTHWNRLVTQWLSERVDDNFWAAYYPGRPLLVTTNDYGMDLFNGDTGVVLRRDGRLIAAFDRGTQTREIAVARLSDVETMYAATVHKSQGSQAEHVTVVLPEMDSPLLTRELIYTAVTRAQREVTLIGTPAAIVEGLARRSVRASGLRQRLTQDFPTLSPQS